VSETGVPALEDLALLTRGDREDLVALGWALVHRTGLDLLSWSRLHRLEDGEVLDFGAFPFQRELYQAFGDRELPSVDVMKSSQCGISSAGVSLALYAADVWGAHVMYVLPTEDLAQGFSETRVKPAIEADAYLRSLVTATNSKGLRRLGKGNLYFVGSGSEARALSVPADLLILDEFDRLDHRQAPKFRSRLNSPASMKLLRRFSNPSFPEAGIHARWLASDQRTWVVACPSCSRVAPISYEEGAGHYVDEDRKARVCGKCRRPLPREAVAGGRWVPAYPDRDLRGYHVSRLIVPDEDIADLVEHHGEGSEEEIAVHRNFDLGLPYAPKGGSLTSELVRACRREYECPEHYRGSQWVTAGVDVGKVLHLRISRWHPSGNAVPLFIGEVPGFEDLAHLWGAYGVNFGLVDERPEERMARDFADRFAGRAALLRWGGQGQLDPYDFDEDRRLVTARRTWACDQTVAAVTDQRRLLPKRLPDGYLRQMTALHRITDTTPGGQKVSRYVGERADHYFFAETFDLLARAVRPGGQKPAGGWGPPPTRTRR
jgi:hypothetical protein